MSLEKAVEENTAAIRALIAVLDRGVLPAKPEQKLVEPKAEAKTTAKPKAKAVEPEVEAEDKVYTYDEVKTRILKLIEEKGRDAAVTILTSFGATKLPEVAQEELGAVMAACEAA
jgi:hypothetical protein